MPGPFGVPGDVRNRVDPVLLRAKGGRGKLYPDPGSGPDALEHCALIVTMIGPKGTGELPGQWNPDAHQACENLWLAAGGAPHGGWRLRLARSLRGAAIWSLPGSDICQRTRQGL